MKQTDRNSTTVLFFFLVDVTRSYPPENTDYNLNLFLYAVAVLKMLLYSSC